MEVDTAPDYIKKRVLILGCGNILFGDDGFGPAAIAHLQKDCKIPPDVHIMDVGTGANRILLIIALSPETPERIIILDAVDGGRKPGDVFEGSIEDLLKKKVDSLSMHLFPTAHLLQEIRNKGVDIVILACQVEKIPDSVCPGLSVPVKKAVAKAAKMALKSSM